MRYTVPKKFKEELLERWRKDLARKFLPGPDPIFRFFVLDSAKPKDKSNKSKESNDKQTNGKD